MGIWPYVMYPECSSISLADLNTLNRLSLIKRTVEPSKKPKIIPTPNTAFLLGELGLSGRTAEDNRILSACCIPCCAEVSLRRLKSTHTKVDSLPLHVPTDLAELFFSQSLQALTPRLVVDLPRHLVLQKFEQAQLDNFLADL